MVNYIRKQATSCTVGSTTFTDEFVYYAYRPVGSGPGGAIATPRFVANAAWPVAVTPHHIHCEVELCLDADEAAGFYTTDYMTVPGTAVSTLTVTETGVSAGVSKTRTITFNSVYVMNVPQPMKLENKAEHQLFTVLFLCLAEPSFSDWA